MNLDAWLTIGILTITFVALIEAVGRLVSEFPLPDGTFRMSLLALWRVDFCSFQIKQFTLGV